MSFWEKKNYKTTPKKWSEWQTTLSQLCPHAFKTAASTLPRPLIVLFIRLEKSVFGAKQFFAWWYNLFKSAHHVSQLTELQSFCSFLLSRMIVLSQIIQFHFDFYFSSKYYVSLFIHHNEFVFVFLLSLYYSLKNVSFFFLFAVLLKYRRF